MEKNKRFKKFLKIWRLSEGLLKQGREGDVTHAKEVVNFILGYQGKLKLDLDILIPAAMMHDIGHSAILNNHFKYITGYKKLINGKLVHMLAGAKIAKDILKQVNYNKVKSEEIIDIISMHDADQLTGFEWKRVYNTENKRIFHDIDVLDRFKQKRLKSFRALYPNEKQLTKIVKEQLKTFFYKEFKDIASERLKSLFK